MLLHGCLNLIIMSDLLCQTYRANHFQTVQSLATAVAMAVMLEARLSVHSVSSMQEMNTGSVLTGSITIAIAYVSHVYVAFNSVFFLNCY